MFGGFVDGFEFRVTMFSVWSFCEFLIRVLEIFGCSVLRGVLVCVERRLWGFMLWEYSAYALVVTVFARFSVN
jgi:hypothetical protein